MKKKEIQNNPKYKTISIPEELAVLVEKFITENPELGYKTVAEFFKDSARFRISLQDINSFKPELQKLENKIRKIENVLNISDSEEGPIYNIEKSIAFLEDLAPKLGQFTFKFIIINDEEIFKTIYFALLGSDLFLLNSFQKFNNQLIFKFNSVQIELYIFSETNKVNEALNNYFDGIFLLYFNKGEENSSNLETLFEKLTKKDFKNKIIYSTFKNVKDLSLGNKIKNENPNLSIFNLNEKNENLFGIIVDFFQKLVSERANRDVIIFPEEEANKVIKNLYSYKK